MNRAHSTVCIRSELRNQNMTFQMLPGRDLQTVKFQPETDPKTIFNTRTRKKSFFKRKPDPNPINFFLQPERVLPVKKRF